MLLTSVGFCDPESAPQVCISLAQHMHRTELQLRTNLLGEPAQKIRPLNDAKAIANGANAISEGFLFAVACILIVGETYRGSRSRAKQRDRTEEALGDLTRRVEALAEHLGIDLDEAVAPDDEGSEENGDSVPSESASSRMPAKSDSRYPSSVTSPTGRNATSVGALEDDEQNPAESARQKLRARAAAEATERENERAERERLSKAVQLLLSMALRQGWVSGEEGLELERVMQGRDEKQRRETETSSNVRGSNPQQATDSSQRTAHEGSVVEEVARARARALAREVQSGQTGNQEGSTPLAELLARARTSSREGQSGPES